MFKPFADAVHARLNELAKHELYVVDIDGDDLYAHYLNAFPEGTNPIFRVRTEHDCSCCKNFIRNFGRVVAIVNGRVESVWDTFELPEPYFTVAGRLREIVKQKPIVSVFRTKERSYGAEFNYDKETTQRWDHFHGKVADKHFSIKPDEARGDRNTIAKLRALLKDWNENPDWWETATATLRFFGRSPDGVPRFPVVIDFQPTGRHD